MGNATLTGGQLHIALATAVADAEAGTFTEVSETGTCICKTSPTASSWAQQVAVIVQQVQHRFRLQTYAGYGTVTHIVLTDSATWW